MTPYAYAEMESDPMNMPLIRLEGVVLPYWQRISENLWGQFVHPFRRAERSRQQIPT